MLGTSSRRYPTTPRQYCTSRNEAHAPGINASEPSSNMAMAAPRSLFNVNTPPARNPAPTVNNTAAAAPVLQGTVRLIPGYAFAGAARPVVPVRQRQTQPRRRAPAMLWRVCRVCRQSYQPADNHAQACRFHRDPAMTGAENSKLLGTGPLPGHLRGTSFFWDCCGADDPDADGCCTDFHRSYDD